MTFQRVAVAGGTGYVGRKIVNHLLTIPTITKITILTRSAPESTFPTSPLLSVVQIPSYEDAEALVSALKGHDILVSALGGVSVERTDPLLVSAAMAAGIKRFMPSEYTIDVMHPHAIAIAGSTILAGKVANAKDIQALADKGQIEYTTLVTGAILDWWFESGDLGVNIKARKLTIYDGGKRMTGVTTDFIAECVGAVIRMPEESTKNMRIRIAEVEYTSMDLLKVFEEVVGGDWTVEEKSTQALLEEAKQAAAKGDMRGFYIGNILKLNFDGEGAGYFEEGLTHGMGVKRQSLKEIVKNALSDADRSG
jgi:uncharacterized protein YbjT (DUF2867 family)